MSLKKAVKLFSKAKEIINNNEKISTVRNDKIESMVDDRQS